MYIEPFKIKIASEEGGDDILNTLFSMGYTWETGGTEPSDYIYIALCLDKDGYVYQWTYDHGNYKEYPLRDITKFDFYQEINSIIL